MRIDEVTGDPQFDKMLKNIVKPGIIQRLKNLIRSRHDESKLDKKAYGLIARIHFALADRAQKKLETGSLTDSQEKAWIFLQSKHLRIGWFYQMMAEELDYNDSLAQFVQQNYNINPQVDLAKFWKIGKTDNEPR